MVFVASVSCSGDIAIIIPVDLNGSDRTGIFIGRAEELHGGDVLAAVTNDIFRFCSTGCGKAKAGDKNFPSPLGGEG